MASTLKLFDELKRGKANGENNYQLGRMLEDSMPFEGPNPGPLREEEYDELTEVTYTSSVDLFDITIEEQRLKLSQIVDRAVNGWYTIHAMSPAQFITNGDKTQVLVHCVYSVPCRRLNTQRAEAFGLLPTQ